MRLAGNGEVNSQIFNPLEQRRVGSLFGQAAGVVADVGCHALQLALAKKDVIDITIFPAGLAATSLEPANHIAEGFGLTVLRLPGNGQVSLRLGGNAKALLHKYHPVEMIRHYLAFKQLDHRPEFRDPPPAS